ncbi:MAG: hypothetical protein ACOYN5_04490 [Bacteroidales bacterium]
MEKEPKKRFYTEGKRSFIDYNGKPSMLIEVFEFNNQDDAMSCTDKKTVELESQGIPVYMSLTTWNSMIYLLIAIEIHEDIQAANQKHADKMARVMRKLADWYRYTVLLAQSN